MLASKTITDKDTFYIDRDGLVYTPNTSGVLKENYYYDTIVKLDKKRNMYVEVDLDEFDNLKTQEMEVGY
jgi:hypothetical protein